MKVILAILGGIAAVAVILLLVAASAGMSIFGANVEGHVDRLSREGKEMSKIHDADNALGAQARFEALYAEVQTANTRVDTAAAALKASPDDYTAKVNYTGAVNVCVEARNAYNALARTETAEQFRSADLPYQITETDIDCKEATA